MSSPTPNPLGIQVAIDAAAVEKQVVDAIMSSVIGDRLREVVSNELKGYSAQQAIDKAIKQEIWLTMARVVREDYGQEIRAAVKEKIEPMMGGLVEKTLDSFEQVFLRALDKIVDPY